MKAPNTRIAITLSAAGAIAAHLIWPKLSIDGVTLGLLVVAMVPWLGDVIKSLDIPGLAKVEMRKLHEIEEVFPGNPKALRVDFAQSGGPRTEEPPAEPIAREEPPELENPRVSAAAGSQFPPAVETIVANANQALAQLGLAVEDRIWKLAAKHGQLSWRNLNQIVFNLSQMGVLSAGERIGVSELLHVSKIAADGGFVPDAAIQWTSGPGQRMLEALDAKLKQ